MSYLTAAVIPYVWAAQDYPVPPIWLLLAPGWLLGLPGFYITLLGAVLAIPLALLSFVVVARVRRTASTSLFGWSAATMIATSAYAIFTLTPLGQHIASFVMD